MQNKKLVRFVESFILLPVLMSSPVGLTPKAVVENISQTPQVVSFQNSNMLSGVLLALDPSAKPEEDPKLKILQARAEAIDSYFDSHGMPLKGMGMKMAEEADKNGLDWRLLPAISIRESTGGKDDCDKVKHNFFGWASCKIGFSSDEEAIEKVARNLGGNNPKTARYYANKTTKEILKAYNPPSIIPRYVPQVISIMNAIGDEHTGEETDTNSTT